MTNHRMEILILVGLVFLAILIFLISSSGQSGSRTTGDSLPYIANDLLLSRAERSFFGLLQKSLPEGVSAFPMVRVADVLSVRRPLSKSAWQTAFNRISSKHFDFIVCRDSDLHICCAIELDDRSHNRSNRVDRDIFLNEACSAADLPLIRVQNKNAYSTSDIRQILEAIEADVQQMDEERAVPHVIEDRSNRVTIVCPKCSSAMILRTAKRGEKAGQDFWGCTNYPACRVTKQVSKTSA